MMMQQGERGVPTGELPGTWNGFFRLRDRVAKLEALLKVDLAAEEKAEDEAAREAKIAAERAEREARQRARAERQDREDVAKYEAAQARLAARGLLPAVGAVEAAVREMIPPEPEGATAAEDVVTAEEPKERRTRKARKEDAAPAGEPDGV